MRRSLIGWDCGVPPPKPLACCWTLWSTADAAGTRGPVRVVNVERDCRG